METEDNRVSALCANHGLKHGGRGGVRYGRNAAYDADRFRDLHIAFHFVFFDNTDGLRVLNGMPDIFGSKHVLDDFVFEHASSCFLIGELSKRHMLVEARKSHCLYDCVNLLLVELHILLQSLLRLRNITVNHLGYIVLLRFFLCFCHFSYLLFSKTC